MCPSEGFQSVIMSFGRILGYKTITFCFDSMFPASEDYPTDYFPLLPTVVAQKMHLIVAEDSQPPVPARSIHFRYLYFPDHTSLGRMTDVFQHVQVNWMEQG